MALQFLEHRLWCHVSIVFLKNIADLHISGLGIFLERLYLPYKWRSYPSESDPSFAQYHHLTASPWAALQRQKHGTLQSLNSYFLSIYYVFLHILILFINLWLKCLISMIILRYFAMKRQICEINAGRAAKQVDFFQNTVFSSFMYLFLKVYSSIVQFKKHSDTINMLCQCCL